MRPLSKQNVTISKWSMFENEQSIQMRIKMHRLIDKSYTLKEAFIRFCLSVRVFSLCIMSVKTQRKSWLFNFAIKNANGASFEFPMTCLVPVRLRHTKCFLSVSPPGNPLCYTLSSPHYSDKDILKILKSIFRPLKSCPPLASLAD